MCIRTYRYLLHFRNRIPFLNQGGAHFLPHLLLQSAVVVVLQLRVVDDRPHFDFGYQILGFEVDSRIRVEVGVLAIGIGHRGERNLRPMFQNKQRKGKEIVSFFFPNRCAFRFPSAPLPPASSGSDRAVAVQ